VEKGSLHENCQENVQCRGESVKAEKVGPGGKTTWSPRKTDTWVSGLGSRKVGMQLHSKPARTKGSNLEDNTTRVTEKLVDPIATSGLKGPRAVVHVDGGRIPGPRWCPSRITKTQCYRLQKLRQRELAEK
jgi:hypothetical protein